MLPFNWQSEFANAHCWSHVLSWFIFSRYRPAVWRLFRGNLWPCDSCCGWTMIFSWLWAPVSCQPARPCCCSSQLKMPMTRWLSSEQHRAENTRDVIISLQFVSQDFMFQVWGGGGWCCCQSGSLLPDRHSGVAARGWTAQEAALGSVSIFFFCCVFVAGKVLIQDGLFDH